MTRAAAALGLCAIYLATLGHAGWADVATGLLLGVILLRTRGGVPAGEPPRPGAALAALPGLAIVLGREVVRGSWLMLLVVLGRRDWRHAGLVDVPIGGRSERGIAMSALLAGLTPGTVFLDVDRERGVMIFHCVDASDPERIRADIQHQYERYQSRLVP